MTLVISAEWEYCVLLRPGTAVHYSVMLTPLYICSNFQKIYMRSKFIAPQDCRAVGTSTCKARNEDFHWKRGEKTSWNM